MSNMSVRDALRKLKGLLDIMRDATCADSKGDFGGKDVNLEKMSWYWNIPTEKGLSAQRLVEDLVNMRDSIARKAQEDSIFRPTHESLDDWAYDVSVSRIVKGAIASLETRTEVYEPYWLFSGMLEDTESDHKREIKKLKAEIEDIELDFEVEKERLELKVISLEEEDEKSEKEIARLEKRVEELEFVSTNLENDLYDALNAKGK